MFHVSVVNNMVNMEELQNQNAARCAVEMEHKHVGIMEKTVFIQVRTKLSISFRKQGLYQ